MLMGPDGEVGVPVHITPPPKTGTNAPDFTQAVSTAQAATDKYSSSGTKADLNTAEQDWGAVEAIIQDQYRQAYASSDPNAVKQLNQEYGSYFQDHHPHDTAVYNQVLTAAQKEVKTESNTPGLCSALHQQYDAETQFATVAQDPTSSPAYQAAATNLVNADINVQLARMFGAGNNGVYTADQIQKAADVLDKADPNDAPFTDYVAEGMKVNSLLTTIINDPNSLNLTPAETQLKKIDPLTLAFLKADGITVEGTDKNGNLSAQAQLSPDMLALAKASPSLFAMMEVNGVNISTSSTVATPYHLGSGQWLQVTVNGKAFNVNYKSPNGTITPDVLSSAYTYGNEKPGQGVVAAANMLLPQLRANWTTLAKPSDQALASLSSLMGATDGVRAQIAGPEFQKLMAGAPKATQFTVNQGNPDDPSAPSSYTGSLAYIGSKVNPFLTTQLNGFFSPAARSAFFTNTVAPILGPYLKNGVDNGVPFQANDPTYLNRMGQYMQGVLQNASPEVAGLLLKSVEGQLNQVLPKEQGFMPFGEPYGANPAFFSALSHAVQIADQLPGAQPGNNAATQVAQWILAMPQPVVPANAANDFGNDIRNTGNMDLADALRADILKKYPDKINTPQWQDWIPQAEQSWQNKVLGQDFSIFQHNKTSILNTYFSQFSHSTDIGTPIKASDTAALRKAIAAALGYTQSQLNDPNSTQSKVVNLDISWIQNQAGSNGTVTVLPYVYASSTAGVQYGAFFDVTSYNVGNDSHNNQKSHKPSTELIDGLAAQYALEMDPNAYKHPNSVDVKWHYSSYRDFQLSNDMYQGGTIYTLRNNPLGIGPNGAASSATDAWKDIKGVLDVGLGLGGVVLAPFSGGASLALTAAALAWGTYEAYDQYEVDTSHGEHFGWSNPNTRQDILGDGMLAANWLTMGLGGAASSFERAAAKFGGMADGLTNASDLRSAMAAWADGTGDVPAAAMEGDAVPAGDTIPEGAAIAAGAATQGTDNLIQAAALSRALSSTYSDIAQGLTITHKVVGAAAMSYGTYLTGQTLYSLGTNWGSMSWSERAQDALNIGMGVFPFFSEGIAGSDFADNVRQSTRSFIAKRTKATLQWVAARAAAPEGTGTDVLSAIGSPPPDLVPVDLVHVDLVHVDLGMRGFLGVSNDEPFASDNMIAAGHTVEFEGPGAAALDAAAAQTDGASGTAAVPSVDLSQLDAYMVRDPADTAQRTIVLGPDSVTGDTLEGRQLVAHEIAHFHESDDFAALGQSFEFGDGPFSNLDEATTSFIDKLFTDSPIAPDSREGQVFEIYKEMGHDDFMAAYRGKAGTPAYETFKQLAIARFGEPASIKGAPNPIQASTTSGGSPSPHPDSSQAVRNAVVVTGVAALGLQAGWEWGLPHLPGYVDDVADWDFALRGPPLMAQSGATIAKRTLSPRVSTAVSGLASAFFTSDTVANAWRVAQTIHTHPAFWQVSAIETGLFGAGQAILGVRAGISFVKKMTYPAITVKVDAGDTLDGIASSNAVPRNVIEGYQATGFVGVNPTQSARIPITLSLPDLSHMTGTPVDQLQALNPGLTLPGTTPVSPAPLANVTIPKFDTVTGAGKSWKQVAAETGYSVDELWQFNTWQFDPASTPLSLLVPRHTVASGSMAAGTIVPSAPFDMQPGETLKSFAADHGVSPRAIRRANRDAIPASYRIPAKGGVREGDRIELPRPFSNPHGLTWEQIAKKTGRPVDELLNFNRDIGVATPILVPATATAPATTRAPAVNDKAPAVVYLSKQHNWERESPVARRMQIAGGVTLAAGSGTLFYLDWFTKGLFGKIALAPEDVVIALGNATTASLTVLRGKIKKASTITPFSQFGSAFSLMLKGIIHLVSGQ